MRVAAFAIWGVARCFGTSSLFMKRVFVLWWDVAWTIRIEPFCWLFTTQVSCAAISPTATSYRCPHPNTGLNWFFPPSNRFLLTGCSKFSRIDLHGSSCHLFVIVLGMSIQCVVICWVPGVFWSRCWGHFRFGRSKLWAALSLQLQLFQCNRVEAWNQIHLFLSQTSCFYTGLP